MSELARLQYLTVESAAVMIDSKEVCVVDNRDLPSFEARHIDGAVHLSNDNVQQFLEETNRSKPVICCCYHGHSSQQVGQFLLQQGFTEVYNLDGGFEAWRQRFPDNANNESR
jgi:thiosulfate sulfurtransferase